MNSIHTESCADASSRTVSQSVISTSNNNASPAPIPTSRGWLMLFDGAGALVIVAAAGLWFCRALMPDAPGPQAGAAVPVTPAPAVTPAESPTGRDALQPDLQSPNFVLVRKHTENTVAGR